MRLPLANESKGPRHPTNPGKHAVGSERGNAWFGFSFLNPGHVGGRREISPLRNPCSPLSDFVSVVRPAQFSLSYNRSS